MISGSIAYKFATAGFGGRDQVLIDLRLHVPELYTDTISDRENIYSDVEYMFFDISALVLNCSPLMKIVVSGYGPSLY